MVYSDATGAEVVAESLHDDMRLLEEFTRLDWDWDSYGAEPIATAAIEGAYLILNALAARLEPRFGRRVKPYAVAPLADGGVQAEWRGPGGKIAVEIDAAGRYSSLQVSGAEASPRIVESSALSLHDVERQIAAIIGG